MYFIKDFEERFKKLKEESVKNEILTIFDIKNIFNDVDDKQLEYIIDCLKEENIIFYNDIIFDDENLLKTDDKNVGFSNDPLKMYLREISSIKLLSQEEEIYFATLVKEGILARNKLIEYKKNKINVSPSEKNNLRSKITEGEHAKNVLIESNLRLVVYVAKKFLKPGLNLLDLIQEGTLGLIKAVEKYDPNKGFRFATYATWWIRQSINRSIADQTRLIRIPVHLNELINRMHKEKILLYQELNRMPTQEELASKLEISLDRLTQLEQLSLDTRRLDENVGEDDSVLSDFIPDLNSLDPYEHILKQFKYKELESLFMMLTPREAKIIKLRFGLEDNLPKTLDEIGKEFGITRERIRQIEIKALKKLRRIIKKDFKNDLLK